MLTSQGAGSRLPSSLLERVQPSPTRRPHISRTHALHVVSDRELIGAQIVFERDGDAITSSLCGIDSVIVRSTLLAMRLADSTGLDLKLIGEQAQVDAILTGTILSDGECIRVTNQLVEAETGTTLWTNTSQVS